MRLLVLGTEGMLGRAVVAEARRRGIETFTATHRQCDIAVASDVRLHLGVNKPIDAAINCAGMRPLSRPDLMALTNTAGPHVLAHWCGQAGARLIHVSTDCVFDGLASYGNRYRADAPTHPVDFYGASKALGEPQGDGVIVVRTSFIGLDHGLIPWLVGAGAGPVDGWSRAYWTGSTVHIVADALIGLLFRTEKRPVLHLATRTIATKANVLRLIAEAFHLRVVVHDVDDPYLNRALHPDIVIAPVEAGLGALYDEHLARR